MICGLRRHRGACARSMRARAGRIGVRDPDRRQAEHVGEVIVGQCAAQVGQNNRRRPTVAASIRLPSAPRVGGVEPRRFHRFGGARRTSTIAIPRVRCARIAGTKAPVAAGDEAQLQVSAARADRVDGPIRIPGAKGQNPSAFQPNASAGLSAGSPQPDRSPDRRARPVRRSPARP
jgi:hypothetical protein